MAANTDLADINEIYTAYLLNNNEFPDNASEAQYNSKLTKVSATQAMEQTARADAMVGAFLRWGQRNGYSGVQSVYWTARPGFSFKTVTGVDVNQKKNPTDVLVKFRTGGFLGMSAKSTRGKADIGFKNPGVGTVEKDLGVNLSNINKKAVDEAVRTMNLPTSAASRKSTIRRNSGTQLITQKRGYEILEEMRDALLKKLNTLSNEARRDYILKGWMDSSQELYPPYVKVTGRGSAGNFSASIEDPLSNSKLKALMENNITFEKNGDHSVGVKGGSTKILKMRFKYESEPMASSLKMSGDPWS